MTNLPTVRAALIETMCDADTEAGLSPYAIALFADVILAKLSDPAVMDELCADLRAENERLRSRIPWDHPEIQDYINELLLNTPDSYDGDEAAPDIALHYLRDLETDASARNAKLADMNALIDPAIATDPDQVLDKLIEAGALIEIPNGIVTWGGASLYRRRPRTERNEP